jgi:UPF0716 protein FxsA
MFSILFALFIFIPIIELALLIKVGTLVGVWNTIFLNIVISAVGAFIAKYEGMQVLIKTQENLSRGIMPDNELMDGFMIFAGGALLLTPGFLTDAIGILLIFPLTREVIKFFIRKKLKGMFDKGQIVSFHLDQRKDDGYHDIDI